MSKHETIIMIAKKTAQQDKGFFGKIIQDTILL